MYFNVATEFKLTKKPAWLDGFRKKCDDPYQYHITLKTKTSVRSADIARLKNELNNIAKRYGGIKVVFSKLHIATTTKGWCIMIRAKPNRILVELQKEIVKRFSKFGKPIRKEGASFEKIFRPHITIGRHLTPQQLKQAKSDLRGKNLHSEALIQKIVLTTVRTDSFHDWSNLKNKISYKLKV